MTAIDCGATFRLTSLLHSSNGAASTDEGRPHMAWDAPKVREIPVGMEINMYACAKQK